jgi:hypothetical protein
MRKFRATYGQALIQHLEMSEKRNVNLDKDDNLRTVYLTAREIFYLVRCIRRNGGKCADG